MCKRAAAPQQQSTGLFSRHSPQAVHFIQGIVDHGSRFAPLLQTLERPSAWAILAKLFQAIDRFGKPHVIRTDIVPVFHSRIFRAVLCSRGRRPRVHGTGQALAKRAHERFFLTLKLALNRIVPNSGQDLDNLLDELRHWYNDVRPHQHLHGFTPGEVWRGVDPYATAPKEVLAFEGWDGLLRGFYLRR